MAEIIVTNTGPIIALGKMQVFEAIGRLPYEFVCPPEVEAEIGAGAAHGFDIKLPSWLKVWGAKFGHSAAVDSHARHR